MALILRAFPEGVKEKDYLSVLALLSENLCHEHLAIVAEYIKIPDPETAYSSLNDAFKACLLAQSNIPNEEYLRRELNSAGYEEWLETE